MRLSVLSRARVSIRPLAFLVSGSTAESSSSSRALATGNATLGVQGLAGDHHDQDPAAASLSPVAAALEPIDVTLKMVIIFDPLSRSGLVVGASRERVAR